MEARIAQELDGRKPGEVLDLILDTCKSDSIQGLTKEYENLEYLSMSNCDLKSLKGFPTLPKLRRLELMDNQLTGGFGVLSPCQVLTHLNLSGNKIEQMEALEDLKNLPCLKSIDLFNCPITVENDHRDKIFNVIPQLIYIDGIDREGAEAEDSDDEVNGEADSDEDESEEDEEDVDLSYLNSSRVEDEDETEDFIPGDAEHDDEDDDDIDDEEADEAVDGDAADGNTGNNVPNDAANQGTKRKHEDDPEDDAAPAKK